MHGLSLLKTARAANYREKIYFLNNLYTKRQHKDGASRWTSLTAACMSADAAATEKLKDLMEAFGS